MLKTFFLLAFRTLTKHKGYTLLNIIGLAAGLTCFAFIASWIKDESSYDTFNSKADRIVRVVSKSTTSSETFEQAVTASHLANALKTDAPKAAAEWDKNDCYTYLLLRNKSDAKEIEAQLPAFAKKHAEKYMEQANTRLDFSLQPLTSIHLNSHLRFELEPSGSTQNIYIFATIGIFILLIACINYMNLATARASERGKETGVKKVLGAGKTQLIVQHLTESL